MLRLLLLCLAIGCHHHDAVTVDAPVGGTGTCQSCNAATEFCYQQVAGAAMVVTPPDFGCNPLPPSCTATPTCACVLPTVTTCAGGISCDELGGVATVTCSFP